MYKLFPMFNSRNGPIHKSEYNKLGKDEEQLNIWQFPFKKLISEIMKFFQYKFCCVDNFLLLFWISIGWTVYGLFEAVVEFMKIYENEDYEPSTFWNRSYNQFPQNFRRRARICGLAIILAVSLFLIYGLMCFNTSYIFPWLVIYGIIIALELFYWTTYILKMRKFKYGPFMSLLLLTLRWIAIYHVKTVIDNIK